MGGKRCDATVRDRRCRFRLALNERDRSFAVTCFLHWSRGCGWRLFYLALRMLLMADGTVSGATRSGFCRTSAARYLHRTFAAKFYRPHINGSASSLWLPNNAFCDDSGPLSAGALRICAKAVAALACLATHLRTLLRLSVICRLLCCHLHIVGMYDGGAILGIYNDASTRLPAQRAFGSCNNIAPSLSLIHLASDASFEFDGEHFTSYTVECTALLIFRWMVEAACRASTVWRIRAVRYTLQAFASRDLLPRTAWSLIDELTQLVLCLAHRTSLTPYRVLLSHHYGLWPPWLMLRAAIALAGRCIRYVGTWTAVRLLAYNMNFTFLWFLARLLFEDDMYCAYASPVRCCYLPAARALRARAHAFRARLFFIHIPGVRCAPHTRTFRCRVAARCRAASSRTCER